MSIGGIGVSPGSGVTRAPEYVPKLITTEDLIPQIITPDTGLIEEEDGKKILDRTGEVVEVNRPLVKGLFEKGLWRPGNVVAAVFKLENASELEAYNNLLARTSGEDPEVVFVSTSEKFYNGNFVILVRYHEVWYKSPINKK